MASTQYHYVSYEWIKVTRVMRFIGAPLIVVSCLITLFWLNRYFPELMFEKLGVLPIVLVPLSVVLSGVLLGISAWTSIQLEWLSVKIAYSLTVGGLTALVLYNLNYLGSNIFAPIVTVCLVGILSFFILSKLCKYRHSTLVLKVIIGLSFGIVCFALFVLSALNILTSVGWMSENYYVPLSAFGVKII